MVGTPAPASRARAVPTLQDLQKPYAGACFFSFSPKNTWMTPKMIA